MYEGLSKIFRTDAVKIIKLTIRPFGRHHPRSISLPQVDTGPTVSSIFGTFPGSPFLTECQALCDSAWISSMLSKWRPFSFNIILGNRKKSQGAKSGECGWWGMTAILCFARNGSVIWEVVMVKQSGLFSTKFRARFETVAAKRRSRTRNSQFGLLRKILCATTTAV
jgi:hypothetical protein